MTVLLVGGTSSLAMDLIRAFKASGQVFTAGRNNCDIYMDLNNPAEMKALPKGIDVVIHTAASFGGEKSHEIVDAEMVNVMGTLRLCQLSIAAKVNHFIFISSMSAQLTQESPYYSAYALSKKHAEEISYFFCTNQNLSLTILRPSQLYGTNVAFKKHQPLIYNIIEQAERGEDITLYGSNNALRNYLHIDDFVSVVLRVIERRIFGLYNCQYSRDVTLSEVAESAIGAFGGKSKVKFLKEKDVIHDNVFFIDDTLYKKIGYYPSLDIGEGIAMIAKSRIRP
jgi:UDP-glucose 4-epimerase